jgi:intraflagellar transport protein 46
VDAEVLQLVAGFSPARVELFPALCPFLPDYLPSAGDIDAFLKPPRPDGREDELGLKRLDEPAALQSDPTVLDLQLRALSKKSGLDPVAVRALEHADKNPKEVLKWVASIAELRRAAPPPSVRYTRPMPEVDALMQVWPEEFEAMLRQVGGARLAGAPPPPLPALSRTRAHSTRARTPRPQVPLPPADLEVSVDEYARVVCGLLDIPVHSGGAGAAGGSGPGPLIQALHLLFTLYAEFQGNAHFGGAS